MARLNTRDSTSTTGRTALSSIGSRANTPAAVTAASTAMSPGSSSEKENPRSRFNKGKAPVRASAQRSTPTTSDSTTPSMMRKRRRPVLEAELSSDAEADEEEESDISSQSSAHDPDALIDVTDAQLNDSGVNLAGTTSGQRKKVRIFDPNQDEVERRVVQGKSRALEREFNENRDDYMRLDDGKIVEIIERADRNFGGVKQTTDGTIDSRLMASVADLTHRKSARLVMADGATGIDIDDYVSKCVAFMRRGAREAIQNGASSTQRRRSRADDEDDVPDESLDWAYLGQHACYPHNCRPAVMGFLLGPLSLQKRVRVVTQRRAKQRDDGRAETRPEAVQKADLETNEANTVRHVCGKIKARLVQHCKRAEARVQATVADMDESTLTDVQIARIMRKERVTRVGGPSLFDFVVNPDSFGQTVENLFYVSFLIKEGEVGVQMDDEGLPALVPNEESVGEARERNRGKHQAVFSIDYETWGKLKQAFEIRQSLIPHREESVSRVGARGWYS